MVDHMPIKTTQVPSVVLLFDGYILLLLQIKVQMTHLEMSRRTVEKTFNHINQSPEVDYHSSSNV